jgi:hypothetical protein
VLNIEVGSKAAAADVIAQLRTFNTISVGTVSTIVESSENYGATTVSFSVNCNYVGNLDEEETSQTESTAETTEE